MLLGAPTRLLGLAGLKFGCGGPIWSPGGPGGPPLLFFGLLKQLPMMMPVCALGRERSVRDGILDARVSPSFSTFS